MPIDPERDIEKTLRAYAKKRREDAAAPGDLHPATRRLLQGEVSRLRTNTTGAKSSIWTRIFGGTWPQVALNVCVLLVVIAALVALLLPSLARSKFKSSRVVAEMKLKDMNRDKELALAQNRPLARAETERPVAAQSAEAELSEKSAAKRIDVPSASPPPTDSSLALNESAGVPASQSVGNWQAGTGNSAAPHDRKKKDNLLATANSPKEPPPPAAAAPTSAAAADTFDGTSNFKQLEQGITPSQSLAKSAQATPPQSALAAPQPASAPAGQFAYGAANGAPSPSAPGTITFANSLATQANTTAISSDSVGANKGVIAQKFARANQPTNLSRRMRSINKVVLQKFRVEQSGDQIRIVDSDGSVYDGMLQPVGARREAFREKLASEGRVMTVNRGGGIAGGENVVTNSVTLDSLNLGSTFSPELMQYFSVSGTNQSLRLPVVFSGNLVPQFSNTIAGKLSTNTRQSGMPASAAASPAVSPLLFYRLQGEALVGGSNQIDIRAIPAKSER